MSSKRKILIFTLYFWPGYKAGGPIQSVYNLVSLIKNEFDVKIVCLNHDHNDGKSYSNVIKNQWNQFNFGSVFYLSMDHFSIYRIAKILYYETYDVLYLNNFFNIYFSLLPIFLNKIMAKKRVVLAPRGELSNVAMTYKKFRKKIILSLLTSLNFLKTITFQMTSEFEAQEVRKLLPSNVLYIAQNIVRKPEDFKSLRIKSVNSTKFMYLSRIHPKKNLHVFLNALKTTLWSIELEIIGSISDQKYWLSCQEIIKNLPPNISIKYSGSIPHNEVVQRIKSANFYVLLSKNENFGHTVYEALSAGVPVIISDQLPWQDVKQKNAGWCINIEDEEDLAKMIEACVLMDQTTYAMHQTSAYQYALDYYTKQSIEIYRKMFGGKND